MKYKFLIYINHNFDTHNTKILTMDPRFDLRLFLIVGWQRKAARYIYICLHKTEIKIKKKEKYSNYVQYFVTVY